MLVLSLMRKLEIEKKLEQKKRILFFIFLLTILNVQLRGQAKKLNYKHIVYVEGLGIGGYGSINYEGVFFQEESKKISLSGRIGIGTDNFIDYQNKFNPNVLLPIAVYAFYGRNHNVEIGISHILSLVVQVSPQFKPYRAVNSHMSFSIGYRYQNYPKGFFAGIRYSPILEFYKHFRHWGSAYVGYCF